MSVSSLMPPVEQRVPRNVQDQKLCALIRECV
ncbi:hypothetical protein SFR_1273 [Streptomyces sp. FR-008]|nr:hypothetical protein SFR_1273 [Streptomyces sp. FR-008]